MTRTGLITGSLLSTLGLAAAAVLGAQAPAGADEASKPPAVILADVAATMAAVETLHLEGTETTAEGRSQLRLDVKATGSLDLSATQGKQRLRLRSVRSRLYYRANESFWRSGAGAPKAVARKIADRWVKIPAKPSEANSLTRGVAPKNILRCVNEVGGTVVTGPPEAIDGQPAIVLIGAGDQPGSAPGKLYVAASGPPLLLRIVQSGPKRAGGSVDKVCGEDEETIKAADYRLSAFDKPVRIVTPRGAIAFPKTPKAKPKSL